MGSRLRWHRTQWVVCAYRQRMVIAMPRCTTVPGCPSIDVGSRCAVFACAKGVQCMQFERTTGTSAVISQRLTLEAGAIPSSRCVRLLAMDGVPAVLPICDIAAPAFHDDIADRGVACHGLPCSGQRPPNMLNTLSHVAAIMPRIFKGGFMPSLTPSVRATAMCRT